MSQGDDASFGPPARPLGNVLFGTCGWTEPTLVRSGAFYPPGASTAEARLRFYATRFPLVEVDSTFYAPPSEENSQRWAERTPAGFVFDVKAHALLTGHAAAPSALPRELRERLPREAAERGRIYARSVPPDVLEELWALHRTALRPLAEAGKLGAVLFQFPYWFTCSRRNRDYLAEVSDRLPFPIAVEFRGGGWLDPERRDATLALLEALGFAHVIVDGPQGFRSSTPPVVARTAPLVVLRFLGRNARTWSAKTRTAAERFDYLYSREELAPWAEAARALAKDAQAVHALMNNCHRDDAVRNAADFAALVRAPGPAPSEPAGRGV